MSRSCTVCTHAQRGSIDRALLAGSPSLRALAAQHAVSPTALFRHREHVPAHLANAQAAAEVAQADDLLKQLRQLKSKAVALLLKAEDAGDYRTALAGIREARVCIETLLEVEGELDRRPTLNIIVDPAWLRVRSAIVEVLQRYPDAAVAVADELLRLEASA